MSPLSKYQTKYQAIVATPLGRIGMGMDGDAVRVLDYLPDDTELKPPLDAVTEAGIAPLLAYFDDARSPLTMRLAPAGTAFQQRVWAALQAIPVGSVLSYGELARQLGTAARAIGGACRSNPIPILIPCHRVVSQDGGLGGYTGERAGDPLNMKRWLLRHEGVRLK